MVTDKESSQFKIRAQPDDITCGPTCLHAVYKYFGLKVDLNEVIKDVCMIPSGGTLAPFLACHALQSGFRAKIYTFNLRVFDPTWFSLPPNMIAKKLDRQIQAKQDDRLKIASTAYREFLRLGGDLCFEDLTPQLLRKYLKTKTPIIVGLSSTYLYKCSREIPATSEPDDILGEPSGHFVVLNDYLRVSKEVVIHDPYYGNPYKQHQYAININHLTNAILLGVVTYDANLLILSRGEV